MEKINGIIHRIPSTSSCCCCFDLRTGGLIIGVLNLISTISCFFTMPWLVPVIFLPINCLWIFGIITEKPVFMLPTILVLIFQFILISIIAYVLFAALLIEAGLAATLGLILLLIPAIAFVLYIFIVQISLYKAMTEQQSSVVEARPHCVEYKADLVQEDFTPEKI